MSGDEPLLQDSKPNQVSELQDLNASRNDQDVYTPLNSK